LIAGLLVVLLVPVVNRYREELHALNSGQGVSLASSIGALADVFLETISQPLQSSFDTTKTTFQYRQGGMLDLVASVLFIHPARMPFVGIEMVEAFGLQVIPRAFWPGKPLTRFPLLMITTLYGGAKTEYSFSSIGLVADAYRAGGWIIVVFFFFVFGAFIAWLYVQGPLSETLSGIVFYTTLLANIILYDKDISTLLINLIQFGPLIWIMIRWVLFSSPHKRNSVTTIPISTYR